MRPQNGNKGKDGGLDRDEKDTHLSACSVILLSGNMGILLAYQRGRLAQISHNRVMGKVRLKT